MSKTGLAFPLHSKKPKQSVPDMARPKKTHASRANWGFITLPFELREEIYEYIFAVDNMEGSSSSWPEYHRETRLSGEWGPFYARAHTWTAFIRTCRLVHTESLHRLHDGFVGFQFKVRFCYPQGLIDESEHNPKPHPLSHAGPINCPLNFVTYLVFIYKDTTHVSGQSNNFDHKAVLERMPRLTDLRVYWLEKRSPIKFLEDAMELLKRLRDLIFWFQGRCNMTKEQRCQAQELVRAAGFPTLFSKPGFSFVAHR